MKFFNLNSVSILSLVKSQLIDSNRWQIEPYFNNHGEKCVRLIWKPSLLIYNYLKSKKDSVQECAGPSPSSLFILRQMGNGINKYHQFYQQFITTIYDDTTHFITLDWYPSALHCSDVNASIEGLTAQHINLILKIPFFEGFSTRTNGSHVWRKEPRSRSGRFDNPTYPYWHKFRLNCWVSSNQGLYARASGKNPSDRNVIPLFCIESQTSKYKAQHRGQYTITLRHNSIDQCIYARGRYWYQMTNSAKIYFYINDEGYMMVRELGGGTYLLYDAHTKQPVHSDSRIHSRWWFYY